MQDKAIHSSASVFKKLGWTGISLCVLCCALPFIGAAIGVGSLTALAFYLEKVAIIALGLGGLAFIYYFWQKRKAKKSITSNACDIDCACKTEKQDNPS